MNEEAQGAKAKTRVRNSKGCVRANMSSAEWAREDTVFSRRQDGAGAVRQCKQMKLWKLIIRERGSCAQNPARVFEFEYQTTSLPRAIKIGEVKALRTLVQTFSGSKQS